MIERDVKIEPFAPQEKREGVISYGVTSYGYDARLGYKFKVFSPINGTEIDPKNFDPKCLVEVDLTPQFHEFVPNNNGQKGDGYCSKCRRRIYIMDTEVCPTSPNFLRIPPHSFVLAETLETFTIPRDVLCIVLGKSTYARCGLIVNVTPGEPEWTGKWTVEISNTTPLPVRIYAGEGIMQTIFIRTDGYTELNSKDILSIIEGKYQGHGSLGPVDKDWLAAIRKEMTCRVSYTDKKGKYDNQKGLTPPKVD